MTRSLINCISYILYNSIRKNWRIMRVGNVAHSWELGKTHTKFMLETPKERRHLAHLGILFGNSTCKI